MSLQNFDAADFLANFWQKKPMFIQQAIADYQSPLDPDDLAGLSLEEEAESRIFIQHDDNTWQLQHGPFEDDHYQSLPEKNWTLLVQAVDYWMDEIHDLKHYFNFIPDWRIDDIMISYAAQGGGVGPHFDQYDVFLLQAKGSRLWKIGQHCDSQTPVLNEQGIKQLAEFDTQAEHLCQPGDIVYIPPGTAHWGISQSDDCMTISIGFRAPSYEQLLLHVSDDVANSCRDDQRYRDNALNTQNHPAQISVEAIEQVTQILQQQLLNKEAITKSFGRLMTEPKYSDGFSASDCQSDEWLKRLDARLAYFEDAQQLLLFANGECIACPKDDLAFIQQLSQQEAVYLPDYTEQQQLLLKQLAALGVYEDAE